MPHHRRSDRRGLLPEKHDILDGEVGQDFLSFLNSGVRMTVDLSAGISTGGTDSVSGFEDVFGAPRADTITGHGGTTCSSVAKATMTLFGLAGNDNLDDGNANDTCVEGTATNCE